MKKKREREIRGKLRWGIKSNTDFRSVRENYNLSSLITFQKKKKKKKLNPIGETPKKKF